MLLGFVAAMPEGRSNLVRALINIPRLLQSAAQCSMNKPLSPPKPPRVSVPVSAEVLEAFQRLAKAGNTSTGKAMAQWLEDTIEGSQYMAGVLEKARRAPKAAIQEMHAYALGLADESGDLLERVRQRGRDDRSVLARDGRSGHSAPIPPPCNTGGKFAGGKIPAAKVQAHADTNGVPPKGKK